MDCYIYFKALVSLESKVIKAVSALQASLIGAVGSGVACALQRRPEAALGLHTWMEIYRDVPIDFSDRIATALAVSGLSEVIAGERHMEFFMQVQVCT